MPVAEVPQRGANVVSGANVSLREELLAYSEGQGRRGGRREQRGMAAAVLQLHEALGEQLDDEDGLETLMREEDDGDVDPGDSDGAYEGGEEEAEAEEEDSTPLPHLAGAECFAAFVRK